MKFLGILGVTTILLVACQVSGEEIIWEPVEDTATAIEIRTDGVLVEAFNSSGDVGTVTVNSVPFENFADLLPNGAAGNMLNGATTGDDDLDALLNVLSYGGGTSTSLAIGGDILEVGEPYMLQVFFTDLRDCCNQRIMTYGDGETPNTADVHASEGGFGQNAVGYFVADGPTQTLTLDTNGFGNAHITAYQVRAVGEPSIIDGDFDNDGAYNVADVDLLGSEIIAGSNNADFDLTGDGVVDLSDQTAWLGEAATANGLTQPYLNGDANLDGTVDAQDLNALALNWQQAIGPWSFGDFNADNIVNANDLNLLALNWQQSVPMGAQAVPEPAVFLLLWPLLAAGLLARTARRHSTA